MGRKTFPFTLSDNKEYLFSERNKKDMDYATLQTKARSAMIKFIKENITNEDKQDGYIYQELLRVYTDKELNAYVTLTIDDKIKALYDSFTVENNDVNLDGFKAILNLDEVDRMLNMLGGIEYKEIYTDDDVIDELKINVKTLRHWKNNQPGVYAFARQNLKKKLKAE